LHRYKVVGSKNFQHITAPSITLHVSNIDANVSEELLRERFGEFGKVTGFKFLPYVSLFCFFFKLTHFMVWFRFDSGERKMALVEMSNLEESVEALIALHNSRLLEQNIRVSFSKSTL
jgi:polypyrimidine tract-binding protein 1